MAKKINISKMRKAIAYAYDVNPRYMPEALEEYFINNRKAA